MPSLPTQAAEIRSQLQAERGAAENLSLCRNLFLERTEVIEDMLKHKLGLCTAPEMLKDLRSLREGLQAIERTIDQHKLVDGPLGLELAFSSRNRWAFISPNPHADGGFRTTYFDESGFSSHRCHPGTDDALYALVDSGYRIPDLGALDRVASTPQWAKGTAWTARLQAYNRGSLSVEELYAPL